jgi:CRISPR-associated protein Cas2
MRRFVLVAYDITENKRLRRIFKLLHGYGEHVQYSVFLCQLTEKDMVVLTEKIKDIIHQKEDQVILIGLGPVGGKSDSLPGHWQVIGMPLSVADYSVMIY